MPRTPVVLFIAGCLGAVTPAEQSPKTFTSWPIREAPAPLRLVISHADVIIVTMQDAMLRQLTEALDRGGPTSALGSCHLDATAVSYRLVREGIAAGRTSDRLRSPTNAPPRWAADLVKANAGARARDVEGFAVDLGPRWVCSVRLRSGRSARTVTALLTPSARLYDTCSPNGIPSIALSGSLTERFARGSGSRCPSRAEPAHSGHCAQASDTTLVHGSPHQLLQLHDRNRTQADREREHGVRA